MFKDLSNIEKMANSENDYFRIFPLTTEQYYCEGKIVYK